MTDKSADGNSSDAAVICWIMTQLLSVLKYFQEKPCSFIFHPAATTISKGILSVINVIHQSTVHLFGGR